MQAKNVFLNKQVNMVMTIKRGTDRAQIQDLIEKFVEEKQLEGIDAYKYCGVLQLKKSPLDIQNQLRSEWD